VTAKIQTKSLSPLSDNLRFLRALIARPKHIGAVVPSGPALSRAIARQLDPSCPGPVLELGPGTGVITAALLEHGFTPDRLTLIEYDSDFAAELAARFHGLRVIEGDAFNLTHTLNGLDQPFAGIISGLPLLNFPMSKRLALVNGALARLAPGAPLVQFSYGLEPPVKAPRGYGVVRAAFVWANLPPARVWVYRKI
jgi:phosphatidylethanolamine/phosphatidyl-N-methylethanolamine N-methyltransferase